MISVFRSVMAAMCLALLAAGGLAPTASAQTPALTATTPDQASIPEYQLGAADKLRVIVYGEQSLSGEFVISGNGKISLPLVGEVQAAGLTVRTFQTAVESALRDGYLKEPRVSVEVLNYRPYYIMGEIGSPGRYSYVSDLTVLNAVATAGGFTYRANKGKVFIKRIGDTEERSYPLDATTVVLPGDTIRIGERLF